jgi:hypothetical protein
MPQKKFGWHKGYQDAEQISIGRIAETTICMAISPSLPYGRLQRLFYCLMAGSRAYLAALEQASETT